MIFIMLCTVFILTFVLHIVLCLVIAMSVVKRYNLYF